MLYTVCAITFHFLLQDGNTALHIASDQAQLEVVRLLLDMKTGIMDMVNQV